MESPLDIFESIKFDIIPVKYIPEYKYEDTYYEISYTLGIIYSSIDLINWYRIENGDIPKESSVLSYTHYSNSIRGIKISHPSLYDGLKKLNVSYSETNIIQILVNEKFKLYYIKLNHILGGYFLVKF